VIISTERIEIWMSEREFESMPSPPRRGAQRAGWVKTATKIEFLNTDKLPLGSDEPTPHPSEEGTVSLLLRRRKLSRTQV
jgi:hypothetical protein